MKKLSILAFSASAVAALSIVSSAYADHHEDKNEKCEMIKMKKAEHIAQFDTDGDGELSDAEKVAIKLERFNRADTDGSGSLTLQELSNAREARKDDMKVKADARHFERLDKDGDGSASFEEFSSAMSEMNKRGHADGGKKEEKRQSKDMMNKIHAEKIAQMDTNGDGKLSDAEKEAAKAAKFAKADLNADGKLTQDEVTSFHEEQRGNMKEQVQSKHFEQLDANGDGVIQLEEFDSENKMKHGGDKHADECK